MVSLIGYVSQVCAKETNDLNSLQLVGQLLARHVAHWDQFPPLFQCLLPRHDNLPQPCRAKQTPCDREQPLRPPCRRCHDHDLLVRKFHRSCRLPQQPCLLRKRLQCCQGIRRIRCLQLVRTLHSSQLTQRHVLTPIPQASLCHLNSLGRHVHFPPPPSSTKDDGTTNVARRITAYGPHQKWTHLQLQLQELWDGRFVHGQCQGSLILWLLRMCYLRIS